MPELGVGNIQYLFMTKTSWDAGGVDFTIVVTVIFLAVVIDIPQLRKTVTFAQDHVASEWQS